MNISDEVIEAVTGMHPEEREYPDDVRRDFVDTARWARKETLREAEAAIKARLQGSISVNEDAWEAYWEARDQATDAIRALLNGGTS